MDVDIRELLKENLRVSRENNKLLKKLVRKERWASAMRILYWLVLLGVALSIYYYIQPYVEDAVGLYETVDQNIENLREAIPTRSEVEQ